MSKEISRETLKSIAVPPWRTAYHPSGSAVRGGVAETSTLCRHSTKENYMKSALALAMPTLLLSLSVAACSGDKPAVCSSVNNLKSSFDDVKNIDVRSSGALTDLQSG